MPPTFAVDVVTENPSLGGHPTIEQDADVCRVSEHMLERAVDLEVTAFDDHEAHIIRGHVGSSLMGGLDGPRRNQLTESGVHVPRRRRAHGDPSWQAAVSRDLAASSGDVQ
jgi:hypothetical protein